MALEDRKLASYMYGYLLDLRRTLWVWINWVTLVHVAIFLQAIFGAFSDNTSIKLANWIVIAGVCFGLFAFVVPTLHALRFFSSCSLFLSLIYTCIAIGVSFSDGNIFFLPLSLRVSDPASCTVDRVFILQCLRFLSSMG